MKFIAIGTILGIAIGLMSFGIIKLFEHIDKESKTNINKRDTIVISIVSILIGTLGTIFMWDKQVGVIENAAVLIHLALLAIFLIFQSYFDQKTKLVYSAVSILMVLLEMVFVILRVINGDIHFYGIYQFAVLLIPAVLFIVSLFGGIGLGDVIIYAAIAIYYLGSRQDPVISLLINVIMTNIMFIIYTAIYKIVKKDKGKHYPLTMFIASVTILFTIFGV